MPLSRAYVTLKKYVYYAFYSQETCEILNIGTCKCLNLKFLLIICFLNLEKIMF